MKLYNSKFFHRDLSWLRFNHRVLQEVSDKRNPLYERIKFLAIFSSNLDEFFRVRVSDIRQIKSLEKPLRKKLITKPNKVLKEIKAQVHLQQEEFGRIFQNEIIPDLKDEGIFLIDYHEFSPSQKEIAKAYFKKTLKPLLNLDVSYHTKPDSIFVENEASYLTTLTGDTLQLVKIPESEARFYSFPSENGKHFITFIDDILKYGLGNLHEDDDVRYYALKISRDAELYIEDEFSGDLMKKIKSSLPKRDKGQPTRVLIDKRMPEKFQEVLKEALDIYNTDLVYGGRHHNFKDFFSFPNPTDKDLHFKPLPPLPHPVLSNSENIFATIDEKDQLLHYPYQEFEPVINLVETAAEDPSVTTIKMTLYRLAETSRLNTAIAKAAKNGKEVIVFIEVKARFDEKNNIKWGTIFEDNGATVIYSYPDIKVHSKILYIERKVEDKTKRYAYISTGNFNEKTAKLYTDFGLMTAHKKITKDLNKVFMVLQRVTIVPKTKRLLVSPFTTRITLENLVNKEIENAQQGKESYIILKMNSLQDESMINLLYKANNAGVSIKLIVRGMCSLVPGIANQSEHIEVISILDRFLEHGRIYIFSNGGEELMYIGSADWMTRNLTHRIEVLTPILDKDVHKTICDLIHIQLADNVKARIIDAKQSNTYVENSKTKVRAQYATYDYFSK
ncbi:polyphosphate kinase 1 [Winogradskyella bathintestinalis]|uniref:Polyphosphate kinase n=1 Tax=Winogradskyella bathintestinalis TaxID=3035208 RepID=A0ABT7ZY32_9FLAO|nr:polyphosphate kinase 1 [Winogradskyella bathintestinalis]MDN3493902.1 polyphosphate kinase 1 [Winogradskyella bathintestinalis]